MSAAKAARQLFLGGHGRWRGRTVGLYGGSFNPAHAGHRHVSLTALKALGLDALWWLVSPGNPLKAERDMAPLAQRLAQAQAIARHPRFFVTDVEQALGSVYSAHSVAALRRRHPRTRFVWIMGADNLADFHHWRDWEKIFKSLPIAVIDRPGYAFCALAAPAARHFQRWRAPAGRARALAAMDPPAWVFLRIPRHRASATVLRQAAAGDWPLAAQRGARLSRHGIVEAP
ncbi:MAG: nicotinate-nucleotide adenylyltransferase [Pseudomonadota bacterium]